MATYNHGGRVPMSRRRFLRLGAGAATLALLGGGAPALAHSGERNHKLGSAGDEIITHVRTDARKVCLTFDDLWSEYFTLKICRAFHRRGIRLTLFPIGHAVQNNIKRPNEGYANLYPRLRDMGHEFGSHLFTHRPINDFSLQQLIDEEMEPSLNAMRRVFGPSFRPVGLRPPYGKVTEPVRELAARYGIPLILWGLDSQDALCTDRLCNDSCVPVEDTGTVKYLRYLEDDLPGGVCLQDQCAKRCAESILNNYENYLRPGTIILHHALKASFLAIPRIIELLTDWNLQPVPLSELLAHRSV